MGEMSTIMGASIVREFREVAKAADAESQLVGGVKPGDTKLIWDPDNEHEVAAARKMFNSLRDKRFLAFKVGEKGRKGEQITTFDPSLEKIIMSPAIAGG
jgi:hypothetical protein